jgi:hypothetical protein
MSNESGGFFGSDSADVGSEEHMDSMYKNIKCIECQYLGDRGIDSNVSYLPTCDRSEKRRDIPFYTKPSKIGLVAVVLEDVPRWCPLVEEKAL